MPALARALTGFAGSVALVSVALATGCMGGGDEAGPTIDESLLREPGVLTVCTDPTRPPLQYRTTDGVLRGFEVELMVEIAGRLDLGVAWVDAHRDELVDALLDERCDAIASAWAVRRDGGGELGRIAATAYLSVPASLLVRRGERSIVAPGLCGRRVGVLDGAREAELLAELGSQCGRDGRAEVDVVAFASTPDVLVALTSGGIDATLAEHPVNAWLAQRQTDRFDLAAIVGEEVVRWAIGSDPGRVEVYDGIRAGLREIHEDGTFRDLLASWGLDRDGAVPLPTT